MFFKSHSRVAKGLLECLKHEVNEGIFVNPLIPKTTKILNPKPNP